MEFLYEVNANIIQAVFFALMLGALETGFRLGRKHVSGLTQETKSHVSTIAAAILGVLGLLLGFTMSMAVSRFEIRKQLVLEEANAIGTSYLRTKLLPPKEGADIANLLCEYVAVRLQYSDSNFEIEQVIAGRGRSAVLQNDFWSRAVAYGLKDPNPVRAGLLLQSLNQVIDLDAARWMAFQNHVPETVIYMNAIVALLAAILLGFDFGISKHRQFFSSTVLAISITIVLAVILDLDRPRHGFIRVSQQPMIDLQRQLPPPAQRSLADSE